MITDLWGRGYSEAPFGLPHDERLYASQILLAISTSSVSWTGSGSGGFRLVGYSLGGGLAVSFAAFFPQLVCSVVLMGPGGLHRELPPDYRSLWIRHPQLFPRPYIKRRIRQLLVRDSRAYGQVLKDNIERTAPKNHIPESSGEGSTSPRTQKAELLDVDALVNWQIDNNRNFVHSVTSSLKHAPITNQHHRWSKLGSYLRNREYPHPASSEPPNRLYGQKVLLLLGSLDDIVDNDQVHKDSKRTLGHQSVIVVYIGGAGHNFPMTHGEEVIEAISRFWGFLP